MNHCQVRINLTLLSIFPPTTTHNGNYTEENSPDHRLQYGRHWLAIAKNFHDRGFYVFATARDPAKVGDLSELSNVEILKLDVTVPETISQCKDIVTKRTDGSLDILVNNAGVEFLSPLLDVDVTEAKKLYDVNVWGPLAMVQAFAPLSIDAKGVIVNQSSIDGVMNMVWAG